jgi:murein DD-endopeptidase MepM/ murein hydrolase activator NlpD
MKKKIYAFFICTSLLSGQILPVASESQDFSDEDAWYKKCTQVQTSRSGVEACEAFLEYTENKKDTLAASIESYTSQIENLTKNTEELESLIETQRTLLSDLNEQIEQKQQTISSLEENIAAIDVKIEQKQAEIDTWDEQIRSRMQGEQASVGINMVLDLLMGAQNLSDMIRRLSGIERITESDQSQVDELTALKEQLDFQKEEQQRLVDNVQKEQDDLLEQQSQAQALEEIYESLKEEYEANIADLNAAKRSAQVDMESIQEFTISATKILAESIVPADGLIFPIQAGKQSAGTWAYSGGGLHLGLDWATSIGTQVLAPADGIILYAGNPVASNSGYLGNWSGYPEGGGNTVGMLINLKGTLFFISFSHLAQEGMNVKAGDSVSQGQQIALTGNSGNSSGPHCHIEMINLGNMSLSDAIAKFSASADFAWGAGWNSTATACENGASTPCRERPEKYLLNGD